ncbi:hypothetical protein DdX_12087 [Ditylenchus destructor]|uniref:Uncharacterized protein n=1 Tax=Ditylenchus destructor TaxID=166010 RepID=A0AAD4N171_9BILA|nr:hypothetical protein DdX_12087 [Ditylenchus destructor]
MARLRLFEIILALIIYPIYLLLSIIAYFKDKSSEESLKHEGFDLQQNVRFIIAGSTISKARKAWQVVIEVRKSVLQSSIRLLLIDPNGEQLILCLKANNCKTSSKSNCTFVRIGHSFVERRETFRRWRIRIQGVAK